MNYEYIHKIHSYIHEYEYIFQISFCLHASIYIKMGYGIAPQYQI